MTLPFLLAIPMEIIVVVAVVVAAVAVVVAAVAVVVAAVAVVAVAVVLLLRLLPFRLLLLLCFAKATTRTSSQPV